MATQIRNGKVYRDGVETGLKSNLTPDSIKGVQDRAQNVPQGAMPDIEAIRARAGAMPKASQEVMDIRNANRPKEHGGAIPSAIGNAYNALPQEQKQNFTQMNGGQQDSFAKSFGIPAQMPQVQTQGATPGAMPGQLSQGNIQQEAGYQINKERSDLKTAVTKRLEQLRNNANYSNKLIQDNRTLQDFNRSQKANPFSGRTSYEDAQIGRGRDIDDTFRGANLDSELNAVSEDLYNFDKLAPDKQRALMNEMTRIERDYGLQVGQLTGNFNGQQTLAAKNADRNFGLQEGALTGNYQGQQTLQAQGQQFNQEMATDQFGAQEEQRGLDNQFRQESLNFQKATTAWDQAFKNQQFDFNKAETLWNQQFQNKNFNQSVKDSAKQLGLNYSKMNQQEQQFATEMAYKKEAFNYQKEQDALLEKVEKEGIDIGKVMKELNDLYTAKNTVTGEVSIKNQDQLRNAIIGRGYSDDVTDALLLQYGIPIN